MVFNNPCITFVFISSFFCHYKCNTTYPILIISNIFHIFKKYKKSKFNISFANATLC